jgi:Domain of unknown function (DUF4139)/N-terminal domain of unknown function (DUF4140)
MLLLATDRPSGADGQLPETAASRVDRVLVYSSQARIFRQLRVRASADGSTRVSLGQLPSTAHVDSLQVSSRSAAVERVEIIEQPDARPLRRRVTRLADQLHGLLDQLRLIKARCGILRQELHFIRGLGHKEADAPARDRRSDQLALESWRQVLRWQQTRTAKIRAKLQQHAQERRLLLDKVQTLEVAARNLGPAAGDGPTAQGLRVFVTLRGRKPPAGGTSVHRLTLSYLVDKVRWLPAYDLSYDATNRRLNVTYYAVVQQRTGEDWPNAQLRFSTALPVQAVAVPELATVTLGRMDGFMPTPQPRHAWQPRWWSPKAPARANDGGMVFLRSALVEANRLSAPVETPRARSLREAAAIAPLPGVRTESSRTPRGELYEKITNTVDGIRRIMAKARNSKDLIKLNCVSDKLARILLLRGEDRARLSRARAKQIVLYQQVVALGHEAEACIGEEISFVGATHVEMAVDMSPPGPAPLPLERLPWTVAAYRPPRLHRDLPAAAAKGYRYTLVAPGRHRVEASARRRRVPLLRASFKVDPTHRILPGLSKAAYVIARLTNTTGRPILRGRVSLYAGTHYLGNSWLNTALPGRSLQIPLGVDDLVKVQRQITRHTATRGVVFKDDATRYRVQIELANHRTYPIKVELRDQIPARLGDKVELKGLTCRVEATVGPCAGRPGQTRGWNAPDKAGRLIWVGRIRPGAIKRLGFSFTLVRPQDRRLHLSRAAAAGGAR